MNYFNYDSYCGIFCGACDIMKAYQTGHKTSFASFWKGSTVKKLQKSLGITYDDSKPFELACHGCKTDSLFVNCKCCAIRGCAIERKVDHCADCGEYPCRLFSDWQKMGTFLPHLKQVPGNLENIKKTGVNRWLADQEKRWECPQCRTRFAWYSSACDNCGHDLRQYTSRFGILKSAILKLGIQLASLRGEKKG